MKKETNVYQELKKKNNNFIILSIDQKATYFYIFKNYEDSFKKFLFNWL